MIILEKSYLKSHNYFTASTPLSRVLSNLSNNSWISFSSIIRGGQTANTSPIALRIIPSPWPFSAKTGPALPIGSKGSLVFLSIKNCQKF